MLPALLLVATLPLLASEDARRSYLPLRDDESWAWLRDAPADHDPWDPWKYARIFGRDELFVGLGGETRQWVEGYRNEKWGGTPFATNVYWLQRYMLHVDAHLTPYARVFVQVKSGIEVGRKGGPRPTDEDRLDFNQVYVDTVFVPGKSLDAPPRALVRIGMQELSYGSGRLVAAREGPNVRLGQDGIRVISRGGPFRVDAFAVRPQTTQPKALEDGANVHQAFWGTWGTYDVPALVVDAYYLGIERDDFKYQRIEGHEVRHTVGGRIRARSPAADVEVEAVHQAGRVAAIPISAWTVALEAVLRPPGAPWAPVATLGFGITSGDGGVSSRSLGTFTPLFPRGMYFGFISANGPSNDVSPHLQLTETLPGGWTASLEGWLFWRENVHDGVYSVPGNLLRAGNASEGRYLGSQVEGTVGWPIDRHLVLNATLAYFATGSFFRGNGPGENITYGAAWATYKF